MDCEKDGKARVEIEEKMIVEAFRAMAPGQNESII